MVLLGPAWLAAAREGLLGLSFACVLCLLPGCIVFCAAAFYGLGGSRVPLVILAGTVLRMMFVLLGMVVVQSLDQRLGFREFVVWLLVFYLAMLAFETYLVLPRASRRQNKPGVGI